MPTKANNSLFIAGNIAAYEGYAISSYSHTDKYILRNQINNFRLIADFNRQTVTGEITNRYKRYIIRSDITSDKHFLEPIRLSSTGIIIDPNSQILHFNGITSVNSGERSTQGQGEYSGHFAGPNADEVVGKASIRYNSGASEDISFGGKKK